MWKVEDNGGNVLRARNLSSLKIATAFTRRMETGELLAVCSGFLEVGEEQSWGFTLDQTAEAEEDCHCVRGWAVITTGTWSWVGSWVGVMLYFSSLVVLGRYAFDALFCDVAQDVEVRSSAEIELSHLFYRSACFTVAISPSSFALGKHELCFI